MKFNDEQKLIIDASLDKNMLVSAAAGSGKTTVLTERIIRKLLGENCGNKNISLSNILVMTFTKKATAEMKARIKQKLDEELVKNNENTKILKESAIIQNANISTIDAFCKRLLEENYTVLDEKNSLYFDFDPSYRVADGKEIAILQEDVLDVFLEKVYGNKKYKNLFDLYIQKTDESELRDILNNGINFLSSVTWPVEYLDNQIKHFDEYSKMAFNDYFKLLLADFEKVISDILEIKQKVDNYISVCRETLSSKVNANGNSLSEVASKQIENSIKYFSELVEILDMLKSKMDIILNVEKMSSYECSDLIKRIIKISKENKVFVKAGTMIDYDKKSNDEFKAYIEDLFKHLNVLIDIWRTANLSDDIVCSRNDLLYMELLKEYYIEIVNAKKKRNIYEISDFARLALDILYDRTVDENGEVKRIISNVAKTIGDRYELIFIDEYQDTNYIQEKILAAISDDFNKGNVFMVGDIKQSIYGFRNAEPSIFANKYKQYKLEKGGINRTLSVNYRSTKEIISYVNDLFSKTMTPDYGNIDYSEDNELAPKDSEKDKITTEESKVEIKVITKENIINDENDGEKGKVDDTQHAQIEYEADYVAAKISEIVNNNNKKYSDIVILLRATKDKAKIFEEALQRHKIPSYTEQKTGFFQKSEIRLMTDILEVIDNPLQNIPFVAVMQSSVFNITNNELAFIKVVYTENIYNSASAGDKEYYIKKSNYAYFDAVKYVANLFSIKTDDESIVSVTDDEVNIFEKMIKEYNIDAEKLKSKINKFFNFFTDVECRVRYLSISDLIWYIYNKLNIKNLMSAKADGKLRSENLENLYNFAVNFQNSTYVGLFNFNRYIKKFKEVNADQGQAKIYDENANVVRIMTIHSSKGLQFDTVFLCGCNAKYRLDDTSDKALYQFDQKYGLSLDYYNAKINSVSVTPKKKLIAKCKKDEILQEELRMLYVALTRAKNKLYIVGSAGTGGKIGFTTKNLENFTKEKMKELNINLNIRDCDCYLDVVLANYPVKDERYCSFESLSWSISEETDSNDEFDFSQIDDEEREQNDIVVNDLSYFEVADIEQIEKNLNNLYEYIDYQKLKPKFSVSAIKRVRAKDLNKHTKNVHILISEGETSFDDIVNDKSEDNKIIVTGIDLGNAYHRFMQFFDYDSNKYENPKEHKTEMSADKIVNDFKIKEFLNTTIGIEMTNAYKSGQLYREYKFMKLYSKAEIDSYMYEKPEVDNIKFEILNEKNIIIQGIIDAFYIKKDKDNNKYIVLVDYKTDAMNKDNVDKEALKKNLLNTYKVQIDLYANALSELTGLEVRERYLYSFAIGEAIAA